jgi:hypothetical protein
LKNPQISNALCPNNSGFGQMFQFLLQRCAAQLSQPKQLVEVERTFRQAKQPPKKAGAAVCEQGIGQRHVENLA